MPRTAFHRLRRKSTASAWHVPKRHLISAAPDTRNRAGYASALDSLMAAAATNRAACQTMSSGVKMLHRRVAYGVRRRRFGSRRLHQPACRRNQHRQIPSRRSGLCAARWEAMISTRSSGDVGQSSRRGNDPTAAIRMAPVNERYGRARRAARKNGVMVIGRA